MSEIDRDFTQWFAQEMPARPTCSDDNVKTDLKEPPPCEDVKAPAQARPCKTEIMNQINASPMMNKKQ